MTMGPRPRSVISADNVLCGSMTTVGASSSSRPSLEIEASPHEIWIAITFRLDLFNTSKAIPGISVFCLTILSLIISRSFTFEPTGRIEIEESLCAGCLRRLLALRTPAAMTKLTVSIKPQRKIHFGFKVDNLEEARKQVEEAGAAFQSLGGRATGQGLVDVEVKYYLPNEVRIDLSEHGWLTLTM